MTQFDLPISEPTIMEPPVVSASTGSWEGNEIGARLSEEAHAAINAKLAAWFGRETELQAFDADDVLELGRHVI